MNQFRKICTIVAGAGLMALMCAWNSTGSAAIHTTMNESSYNVFSKGIRVGELKTVCSETA